jgi:hypothetical protein
MVKDPNGKETEPMVQVQHFHFAEDGIDICKGLQLLL